MKTDLRSYINIDSDFSSWQESVRLRIKTANDTSNRSRYTLIFMSLVSAGFIIAIFSYFFSWNKQIAYDYLQHKNEINLIRDGVINEWITTQTYQLPILGIKIMASDIQIFGPLVLMVVSTWLYYEVRREHFTVGRLLGDAFFVLNKHVAQRHSASILLAQEVYHNLIGYTVFNVIPYDQPIRNLGERVISGRAVGSLTIDYKIRRIIIKFLAITPIIALSIILFTRLLTFTLMVSTITGKLHDISNVVGLRLVLLILSVCLLGLAFYTCYINIRKIYLLDNATRSLLDEYQKWAFEVEDALETEEKPKATTSEE